MSEFIYVLRPARLAMLTDGPTPEEAATIGEHAKCLERLLEEGVAILFGRTQTADENTFGIVIFASADEGSARAVMDADPAVRRGVMAAELLPYKVAGMRGG